ncbi:FAD/NAD(P)-binding domain-containing protein [Aspergillus egyptiacus]|nr:FAD/NAD(P)-binding domain-containing protein [Aspergillus egyptiacus]
MGSIGQYLELDALIVGAGFGGVYQLKHLRENGYKVKLVDTATDYGGVWYWNRYPGARVDSTVPHYEFSDPTLWKEWSWKQRFPGSQELRDYFSFVADKWDLRSDTEFSTFISKAVFDEAHDCWYISSACGKEYKAKYFLLNTGFSAKRYTPDWKGIDRFKGTWVHPSYWPKEEPDLRGKKVAVIGTGSTGVQLAQEISKVAGHFVLFQRTPNTALPMGQVDFQNGEQDIPRERYESLFANRNASFGGFSFSFLPRSTFDDSPEQRRRVYEELWQHGDFHFWLATYQDMLFTEEANTEAYNFWKEKVRARIQDPRAREILAPEKKPYGFGCKRISLENGFYEIFNQPNVSLVDVNDTPVVEVTERGIKTTEKEWEFDYVVCATGFDAVTGGLLQMDIRGKGGQTLGSKWKTGTRTYLGMAVAGFPNMFFTYGPQAPTALCNGPTCAEYQGDFIVDAMNYSRKNGLRRLEAQPDAEQRWGDDVRKFAYASLLPKTNSWYMGTNIPGKVQEPLIYLGGVPTYYKSLYGVRQEGFTGFDKV